VICIRIGLPFASEKNVLKPGACFLARLVQYIPALVINQRRGRRDGLIVFPCEVELVFAVRAGLILELWQSPRPAFRL
jgi:hypothetical protein